MPIILNNIVPTQIDTYYNNNTSFNKTGLEKHLNSNLTNKEVKTETWPILPNPQEFFFEDQNTYVRGVLLLDLGRQQQGGQTA